MKTPAPEFSRPLEVARVSPGGSAERISATAEERKMLATRLGVPAIHALRAELAAKPWRGGGLKLTGEIAIDLEQVSVISLEPFRQELTFPVSRYFLAEPPQDNGGEAEMIDAIAGGQVDLGEAVAETLALELDPYPRKPGETFASAEAGKEVAEKNPFSSLASLNPQNNKRK